MSEDDRSAFEALGDPNRREILRLLRKGSRTAGELAESFALSKPTLSHHFRVLKLAGLIRAERRGTSIVYTLQTGVLEDLATELMELASGIRGLRGRKSKVKKEGVP